MNAEQVAQYLQDHPQFFEEHAELMTHLVVPHPHSGRAISITERQMLTLRDKNRQLEAKLGELIGFGEENDVISEKVHALSVALIAATVMDSVLDAIQAHLAGAFAVPDGFGAAAQQVGGQHGWRAGQGADGYVGAVQGLHLRSNGETDAVTGTDQSQHYA